MKPNADDEVSSPIHDAVGVLAHELRTSKGQTINANTPSFQESKDIQGEEQTQNKLRISSFSDDDGDDDGNDKGNDDDEQNEENNPF